MTWYTQNFKTISSLENEARALRSCIIDAKEELSAAKKANDVEYAQELRDQIAWFRKELKAVETVLDP